MTEQILKKGKEDKSSFKSSLRYQFDNNQNTFTAVKYLPRLGFQERGSLEQCAWLHALVLISYQKDMVNE